MKAILPILAVFLSTFASGQTMTPTQGNLKIGEELVRREDYISLKSLHPHNAKYIELLSFFLSLNSGEKSTSPVSKSAFTVLLGAGCHIKRLRITAKPLKVFSQSENCINPSEEPEEKNGMILSRLKCTSGYSLKSLSNASPWRLIVANDILFRSYVCVKN